MTTKPRTIDNLGEGASRRYIEDKKRADLRYIEPELVRRVEPVPVPSISLIAEIEEMIGLERRNIPLALFLAPAKFELYKGYLFSHLLTPKLGSFMNLKDLIKKVKKGKTKERIEKERKKLTEFIAILQDLEEMLRYINSKRGEFHKG